MSKHRAVSSRTTAVAIAVAATAALAVPLPAARATYAGKPGPIVFQRQLNPKDEGSTQLFALSPGTGQVRQLTNFHGGAFAPDYSPNGRQIAFERRFQNGSPDAVFTIGFDGSNPTRLPIACADQCLGIDEPSWTHTGDQIAFGRAFGPIVKDNASTLELATAQLNGAADRAIRTFGLTGTGTEPHGAAWSPNGRLLAVTIQNTTKKPVKGSAIYLIDSTGKIVRRLTPPKLDAGNPDWAPNGKRIVFNSFYEGQSESELYTIRPDGTGMHRLRKEHKKNYAFDPVWSPDGGRIAFVHASQTTLPHIWSIGADGKKVRQETHGSLVDLSPDWGTPPA
jgi:Tol biopolymer transport system component